MKPEELDMIELTENIPKHSLRKYEHGTILIDYGDGNYEVEFSNKLGETTAQVVLNEKDFIVVWKAETEEWEWKK